MSIKQKPLVCQSHRGHRSPPEQGNCVNIVNCVQRVSNQKRAARDVPLNPDKAARNAYKGGHRQLLKQIAAMLKEQKRDLDLIT